MVSRRATGAHISLKEKKRHMTESTGTLVLPIVRVAILADSRMTEVALPAELPLREILPAVRRLLTGDDESADGDDPDPPEHNV